ncbi:docking protein 2-like [Limulus polyphemus]|uniref:Docking protein 2-like n=1 Tax=Limulus polyphemus TaxID=6850 RepID=A0ABM1SDK7_LIMPO|nr:docking protein 2-like [Limulus polyphemus]XP_022241712.1 docking protein 2-like [Limulus polyphemus]
MEKEEAILTGYLWTPPQGISLLKKTWKKGFYGLYTASKRGIQRLESFETEEQFLRQAPNKIFILTDCVKITAAPQKQQANVFEVRTKCHTHIFSAESFQEMTKWITCLQSVAFGIPLPSSSSSDQQDTCSNQHNPQSSSSGVHQEENLLYSSMNAPEVYEVHIVETEASSRCTLLGDYYLIVTSVNISLGEKGPQGQVGRVLFTWPFRHIRRYGSSPTKFSIEAGRKCTSGEGLFIFETKDGNVVFQSVAAHVNLLKMSRSEVNLLENFSGGSGPTYFGKQAAASHENLHMLTQVGKVCPGVIKDTYPYNKTTKSSPESIFHEFRNEDQKSKSLKPLPPITKPPRKSKGLTGKITPTKDMAKPIPKVEHVYDEPDSSNTQFDVHELQYVEPLYDEPEENEQKQTIGENEQDEVDGQCEEPVYAVLEENANRQEISSEQKDGSLAEIRTLLVTDVPKDIGSLSLSRKVISAKGANTIFQQNEKDLGGRYASLNPTKRHIYGKINPINKSPAANIGSELVSPINQSTVWYSEVEVARHSRDEGETTKKQNVNPLVGVEYANMIASQGPTRELMVLQDPNHESSNDSVPSHFMYNDTEYAQVLKKTGKVK